MTPGRATGILLISLAIMRPGRYLVFSCFLTESSQYAGELVNGGRLQIYLFNIHPANLCSANPFHKQFTAPFMS